MNNSITYRVEFDGNDKVSSSNGPCWQGENQAEAISKAEQLARQESGAVDFIGGQFVVWADCGDDAQNVYSTKVIS